MHAAVDDAIVELAAKGCLTATSVLVDAQIPIEAIVRIRQQPIDLGLHLNLTESLGDVGLDQVLPLKTLIIKSHLRRLSTRWLRGRIEDQLDRFETYFGRAPDYVDGHLHIHQLPQVRTALVQSLRSRHLEKHFWIRDTLALTDVQQSFGERFKAWVVGHLGMSALRSRMALCGWTGNRGFLGVYDFTRATEPYELMMRRWLTRCQPATLIMTHPATRAIEGDAIGQARAREYAYLSSAAFKNDLQAAGLRLERTSQTLSDLP